MCAPGTVTETCVRFEVFFAVIKSFGMTFQYLHDLTQSHNGLDHMMMMIIIIIMFQYFVLLSNLLLQSSVPVLSTKS